MIRFDVNGREQRVALPAATPLLGYLRNDLGLNGPKFGCGLGDGGHHLGDQREPRLPSR